MKNTIIYTLAILFFIFFLTQTVIGRETIQKNQFMPKVQLSFFPITPSLLAAMSKTLSGNRKYLVTSVFHDEHKEKTKILRKVLDNMKIAYHYEYKMFKDDPFNNHSYILYIDAKNKEEASYAIKEIQNIGGDYANIHLGRFLIPYALELSPNHRSLNIEEYFEDWIQYSYFIWDLQTVAYEVRNNKYFLETAIESYMNKIHYMTYGGACELKESLDEDTGETIYYPGYSLDYGRLFPCRYSKETASFRFANPSFYKRVQKNYKAMFGKEFKLKDAKKEIEIKHLLLSNNEEVLRYFNDVYNYGSYFKKELHYATNSKGITIFCVDSKRDNNKFCKTKEEVLRHLQYQNKTLHTKEIN